MTYAAYSMPSLEIRRGCAKVPCSDLEIKARVRQGPVQWSRDQGACAQRSRAVISRSRGVCAKVPRSDLEIRARVRRGPAQWSRDRACVRRAPRQRSRDHPPV